MVGQSKSLLVSHLSSRTVNSIRTNSIPEDERNQILRKLESTIETFRSGNATKTSTITSILRILGEDTNVRITQSQKEATFDSYLAEILSIQSSLDESREPDVPGPEHIQHSTESNNIQARKNSKRSQDDKDPESDNDKDKPTIKPKLLESDMPWFTQSNIPSTIYSDPSCKETCWLLRSYNRDIAKAKFFVKIAPNSPSGIPSTQWERFLKGESVDLNQIFTSLHHVFPDEERTGRLGDTEIVFGVSKSKKWVTTASEWSSAWRRASKAIGFAFPHRKEELLEYGDYIKSEFATKLVLLHHKLILYNIALRNEIAGGQHARLTDHQKFSRLYFTIVLLDGVETYSKQLNYKKSTTFPSSSKPEICNKFNLGTCKYSDADCKYHHICKGCNKSGHSKKDCLSQSG
jgi:hypothetical protein